MFILFLQLVLSQQAPLNSGVITALRPELQSLETECAISEPTLTKAVSDTALYINSLSTVCSFDRETYVAPLMTNYRTSYWANAVENGGLLCRFVPAVLCDQIDACTFSAGECQAAEVCSRITTEDGLQQFRTAIAMAEYLFSEGYHELAQDILTETRSAISQVEILSEGCPSTVSTTTPHSSNSPSILSIPEFSGGDGNFRSAAAVSTLSPSESPVASAAVCSPGSVAIRNSWCWDHQYTCESCCNTNYTAGPIRRPCWTPSFTKSACCGIAF